MSKDLSKLLDEWAYEEGPRLRQIRGGDGKERIQIRVCIDSFHGILQFDCDGRPDGQRPHSRDFYLDFLEAKLRHQSSSEPAKFRLTRSQCKKLFEESGMIYHRYVMLLQIGDYERVIRDTTFNMRLFRFVHAHAGDEADRNHLECWWPYLLRIHYTARVMRLLGDSEIDRALGEIAECRRLLKALPARENETFGVEMNRSIEALDQMEKEIRERKPLSELERLERDKQAAITQQRYEEAARLRDRINTLRAKDGEAPAV